MKTNLLPKVSIIILNWNRFQDISECLTSVFASDYLNFDVIVVDNNSQDNSCEKLITLFPQIKLIRNFKNLGYTGGNNVGVKEALRGGSNYVWLLNNDTLVETNTLSLLIEAAEKKSTLGLCSPEIIHFPSGEIQCLLSLFNPDNFKINNIRSPEMLANFEKKIPWLWGTALLIKKEVISQIGYLEENYFSYHEDLDYALRAKKAGYFSEVVLGSKIYHKSHSEEVRKNKKVPLNQIFYTTRNELWFIQQNSRGFHRLQILRRFFADSLNKIGFYKEIDAQECVEATVSGIYAAFFRLGGEWNRAVKPNWFFMKILTWHPYFFSNLLTGNLKDLKVNFQKKIKPDLKLGKHFVFFTKTNGLGGTEFHTIEIIKRLFKKNERITIVCFAENPYAQLLVNENLNGINIVCFSGFSDFLKLFFYLRSLNSNVMLFVKGGFSVFPWWFYLIAALSNNAKKIAIEHLADQPDLDKELNLLCKNKPNFYKKHFGCLKRQKLKYLVQNYCVDKIICVGACIKNNLVDKLGFSAKKIIVVQNGIDPNHFSKNSFQPKSGKDIVCIARLAKEKGIDVLIEAAVLLVKRNFKFKLTIIGDGPLKNEISQKIQDYNLSEYVTLAGQQKDVRPFLNKSDLFVLSSFKEGLPLTILESMASGVPCVVTNVGGNSEVVVDNETGYLVEPGNPEMLAKAISELLIDENKLHFFSLNSILRIKKSFDIEKKMSELINVLAS